MLLSLESFGGGRIIKAYKGHMAYCENSFVLFELPLIMVLHSSLLATVPKHLDIAIYSFDAIVWLFQ